MSDKNRRSQPNIPNPGLSEEAVLELLPAFVLGALETDEMLAVDDYLAQHPHLLARVAELEAAADQLALAAPQVEPPARAKADLMAQVRADANVRAMLSAMDAPTTGRQEAKTPSADTPVDTPVDRPVDVPGVAAPPPARPSGPVLPARPAPGPRRMDERSSPEQGVVQRLREMLGGSFLWPSLAAGSLAALLVVAVFAGQAVSRAGQTAAELTAAQERIAALENQTDELRQINQRLEQELANDRNQLAIFANADRVVALAGTPDAPQASGAFYTGPDNGLLVLRNLPPLPPEQTYELWLIPGEGNPVPAGLVQVEDTGNNTFTIALSGQPTDFAAVGLSIEPAGGSPAPTGPIVLLGTVG